MTNKLNVLIVEDDETDCNALVAEIKANSDKLCLAGTSKYAHTALDFIRNHHPHAVILDLELKAGVGDGMDLLENLHNSVICPKPYIIINTNSASKITSIRAKKLGADYEFAKWQQGYSPKMVIDHLLRIMPEILGYEEEPPVPLSDQQLENKMRIFVQDEFNKLGLKIKNKGYDYLVEAVILAANGQNHNWGKSISAKLGINEDGISHAMQYAIERAWTRSNSNDIQMHYTAPLPKGKTEPTPVDFVLYYKQKLLRYLNSL